ncbi:MAG TPA: ATP-binding protein [Gemmatimonadaceae bacterium]|jgi:PAS domain S-box-containing protein
MTLAPELVIVAIAVIVVAAQQLYVRAQLREQRRIQAALRASQERFSGILEIAADAIVTVDHQQHVVHFNQGAEETFGYSADDVIGKHLSVLIPARFRGTHDGHMERFAQSSVRARRMSDRREIFGLRADGTEFPAEASISKLETADGLLFTTVIRDITRQKRNEDDDRFVAGAAADLAQTLAVDATRQAIVDLPIPRLAEACMLDLVAPGDTFERVSSTRQRTQFTPALLALQSMPLTHDSPSPVIDVVRRNTREVVDVVDDDWLETHVDPDAIVHWRALGARSLLILPLHAGAETLGALTLISSKERAFDAECQCVAEKFATSAATALANARLYEHARQANRARDEVLGLVSHDLRNPINAIAMCARVLRDNPPADARERDELLATIGESTEWVNRLIQDLLDVANIEHGRLSLHVALHEPQELVMQAMHMFQLEASEKQIVLEARVASDLPCVSADGARIVQVLGNLTRNAIKYSEPGGSVIIAASRCDNGVEFSVCDTGAGISPSDQDQIFDRYWQVRRPGTGPAGSGLGLSIAKGIVEAHGGRLRVTSALGEGSTFYFTLP